MIGRPFDRIPGPLPLRHLDVGREVRRAGQRIVRQVRDRPPLLSRDWRPAPPDFVGVGVQRAGTSWWYSLLEAHPGVQRLPGVKELHHFDEQWLRPESPQSYHRRFPRPEGMLAGEWTPEYLFDPWTPPLLRAAAPEARILVLLRDPVSRFESGVQHAVDRGRIATATIANEAAARGLYGAQLDGLFRAFPHEQVLVLQFEACRAEPTAHLRATYEFVGLDPSFRPPALAEPRNVRTGPRITLPEQLGRSLREYYEADQALLQRLVPDLDYDLWQLGVDHRSG